VGLELPEETVDNSREKIITLQDHRMMLLGLKSEGDLCRMTKTKSWHGSVQCQVECAAPSWWFHRFEPVWGPFIQRLSRQKNTTLREFERAASQVPGLTGIEQTIALSAFRHHQELI
jgi:hypothetical protein